MHCALSRGPLGDVADASISAFYEGFSRQELLAVYFAQRTALADDFSIFLTLFFGYVAVAYFVGDRMNRVEKVFISCLYSVGLFVLILQLHLGVSGLLVVAHALTGSYISGLTYLPTLICLIGWASSIWFMFRSNLGHRNED